MICFTNRTKNKIKKKNIQKKIQDNSPELKKTFLDREIGNTDVMQLPQVEVGRSLSSGELSFMANLPIYQGPR